MRPRFFSGRLRIFRSSMFQRECTWTCATLFSACPPHRFEFFGAMELPMLAASSLFQSCRLSVLNVADILRLLDAILDICGCPPEKFRSICSAIDKLDKMDWAEVCWSFSHTSFRQPFACMMSLTVLRLIVDFVRGVTFARTYSLAPKRRSRCSSCAHGLLNPKWAARFLVYLERGGGR